MQIICMAIQIYSTNIAYTMCRYYHTGTLINSLQVLRSHVYNAELQVGEKLGTIVVVKILYSTM